MYDIDQIDITQVELSSRAQRKACTVVELI
jgi:hypothetical protein